jgi:Na+-driven multidrug efflux pump
MKTGILKSYIAGIKDDAHGEKYLTILRYFLPECITTILLYSVPMLMNAYFIGSLKSTPAYAALGVTSALSHFLTKVSDGFSVGTVIMVGKANGLGNKEDVGRTMRNAFWTTAALGSVIALAIYLYAESICRWFGSPEEVVDLSLPYLLTYFGTDYQYSSYNCLALFTRCQTSSFLSPSHFRYHATYFYHAPLCFYLFTLLS